jgi:hypothetical protein
MRGGQAYSRRTLNSTDSTQLTQLTQDMAGVGESDSDAEAAVRMSFDGSEHSVPAAGEAAAQAAEAAQAELSLPPPAGVANPHTHAHAPQHYRHAPPLVGGGGGGGGPLAAVAAAAGRKRPGGRAAARAAEVGRWVRELLGGGAAPHLAEHGAVRTHTDPARRRPPWAGSRARPCTP